MRRDVVTAHKIYPALQALLGLPEHCISFELRAHVDRLVTVTCEHYVALDAAGIGQLQTVFSEYELVRKPQPDGLADAAAEFRVLDFDAWMRDRTERAHREFMDRTSRLPCR